jgi:hypothetical protein
MSVWDPVVEFQFKHTGSQAAGEEWVCPDAYELPPNEVLEIFRLELIPPVNADTGLIRKFRYVTLMIEGREYETLRINSVMAPLEHQANVGVAVDFGIPYLHRPITGIIPGPLEGTCPKVARGQTLSVKTVADEAISEPYTIVLKAARVRGQDMLLEKVGTPVVSGIIELDNERYVKEPVPVSLETWNELPGGLAQKKPQVFPWFTYARNKADTTPNQWYDFEYYAKVNYDWMNLSWNLVNKENAYIVTHLGVIPHSNSKAVRFYVEGRITMPEFTTRPLPEKNFFPPAMYYDTSVNANIKLAGPKKLIKSFLFHGVKGGIQVIDNGTAIPANGVELHVYGVKVVLR